MNTENKNFGLILMVLAGLFFIGTISYWRYATWQIIDWIAIIVCGYIGFKLYTKK
jgi:hypothetical protein